MSFEAFKPTIFCLVSLKRLLPGPSLKVNCGDTVLHSSLRVGADLPHICFRARGDSTLIIEILGWGTTGWIDSQNRARLHTNRIRSMCDDVVLRGLKSHSLGGQSLGDCTQRPWQPSGVTLRLEVTSPSKKDVGWPASRDRRSGLATARSSQT